MSEKSNGYSVVKDGVYPINYIYYGCYFLLFAGIQALHVFLIIPSSGTFRSLYMLCALLEALIEVGFLAVLSAWLLKQKRKWLHRILLFVAVALLVCRIADLFLVRLMDLSIWEGIGLFVFDETLENLIQLLYASNVTLPIWGLGFFVFASLFAGAYAFFSVSRRLCEKRPFLFSFKSLFGVFVLSSSLLVLSDLFLHFSHEPSECTKYAKALPWKRTIVMPEKENFFVGGYLKPPPVDPFFKEADSSLFALQRKPDLFFFMVESLREDFLTEEVTPHLSSFKKENIAFSQALSIANATHISWFSTFYSLYPFYWSRYQDKSWKQGSPALALLKKMGYEIHVYTGSSMDFYSMGRILFGENKFLADHFHEFRSNPDLPPYQADKMAIESLCQDVRESEQKGGRVFLIFLDSTHFDYSWPLEERTVFAPIEDSVNYVKIACIRDDLSGIKNRYKNALNHVDDLFFQFQSELQKKGLWEDSVVVFTADHGEEFNEYGHMFHASTLSTPQITVPLYMKFPEDKKSLLELYPDQKASQIDIFPTFFHYVTADTYAPSFFHGKSLFEFDPNSYAIGARYNASRTPYQFYMQSGSYRMIVEFCQPKDIFHCNQLRVFSIEDENQEQVPFTPTLLQTQFHYPLDFLFGE